MRLHFGKYRGWDIRDVPSDYLVWAHDEAERLDRYSKAAIADELAYRRASQPSSNHQAPELSHREIVQTLRDKVRTWHRQASQRFHPDHRKGSNEAQIAVNYVYEEFHKIITDLERQYFQPRTKEQS
jgi:hypothetical protein